jgi:PA-IIL fucose-binding lectin
MRPKSVKGFVMRVIIVVAVLSLLPTVSLAGIFDDHRQLKGQYIAEVGELEKLSCPISGKYDCLTWPNDLYKMETRCMQLQGYYNSFGGTLALLAVDKNKIVTAFTIESGIGSPEIRQHRVTFYDCPSMF